MPVTAVTYKSRRPHFMVREYCFAGTALPNDSGVGGVKDWNLWFWRERVKTRGWQALGTFRIEGRGAGLVLVWRDREEFRGITCEVEVGLNVVFVCLHRRPVRWNSPAVRNDISR